MTDVPLPEMTDVHFAMIKKQLDINSASMIREAISLSHPSLDVSVTADTWEPTIEFTVRLPPLKALRFAQVMERTMKRAHRYNGQPKIYVASRVRHAAKWRALQALGVDIVSTWIHEDGEGQSPSKSDLWIRCIEEAASADAVIFYVEEGDPLMGAMVEAGAALAGVVPVYVVKPESMHVGSWVHHPCAGVFSTIDAALTRIYNAHGLDCPISVLTQTKVVV